MRTFTRALTLLFIATSVASVGAVGQTPTPSTIVCIDVATGDDDPAYLYCGEGWARDEFPGLQINIGGDLTQHMAQVGVGSHLIIITHGVEEVPHGFRWGGHSYVGFGHEPEQMPVPGPPFDQLTNVRIDFFACWSSHDPPGIQPSNLDSLIKRMGGASRGHVGHGSTGKVGYTLPFAVMQGTAAKVKKARACLEADESWVDNPPHNRPNASPNQLTAAQAIVNACPDAEGVIIVDLNYHRPAPRPADQSCGLADPMGDMAVIIGLQPAAIPISSQGQLLLVTPIAWWNVVPDDLRWEIPDNPALLGLHAFLQVVIGNLDAPPDGSWIVSNAMDVCLGICAEPYGSSFGVSLVATSSPTLGGTFSVHCVSGP